MSMVKFRTTKALVSTKSTSPWLSLLILTPLTVIFFCCGVYVGSKLTSPRTESVTQSVGYVGLPGTNNVFNKWKNSISRTGGNYLRANTNSVVSEPSRPFAPVHADANRPAAADTKHSSLRTDGTVRSERTIDLSTFHGSIAALRSSSLHASKGSFVTGPSDLDSANILVTAWVYLHGGGGAVKDDDMRTIFSNKLPGCESGRGQQGLSLFVNAWQQSDRQLHVEFGGMDSGCHKLNSGDVKLESKQWYHVGVYTGTDRTALFVDGAEVASSVFDDPHIVQRENPLLIGQYRGGDYPFYGNISHMVVVHGIAADTVKEELTSLVARIKDSDSAAALQQVPGVAAVFPLVDAASEASNTPALETVRGNNGIYTFPPPRVAGYSIEGVGIELLDGIGRRPVTPEMTAASDALGRSRREEIKRGMVHAWNSYKKYAWGRDELKPLSNRGQDNWGGMGVTLVDSLDTLWIMGLKKEFAEARDWVAKKLTFKNAGSVSVFETTIRELGGLLAAFDLSGDQVFLDKARELGDLLMPAFGTRTGIPTGMVNFQTGTAGGGWSGNNAILSELGTVQLEFRYLAQHTKKQVYAEKSMRALQEMNKKRPKHGLFPIKVSVDDGSFTDSQVTFGALGDSFYEYLLKVWLQGGKTETWLRDMYDAAIDGAVEKLLLASDPSGLAFLSDWNGRGNQRKMDHLVCFMPGLLALGAYSDPRGLESPRAQRDLAVGKALMHTCYQMYARQSSGIAPEFVEFPLGGRDMVPSSSAPFYILRPETAESLFILHQLTGEPTYRDWAWDIWTAIDKHCRTNTAYGSLSNVNGAGHIDDRMESFFLAETMKYLYLSQDPDRTIDLAEYVFNTEAHPLRMFKPSDKHVPVPP